MKKSAGKWVSADQTLLQYITCLYSILWRHSASRETDAERGSVSMWSPSECWQSPGLASWPRLPLTSLLLLRRSNCSKYRPPSLRPAPGPALPSGALPAFLKEVQFGAQRSPHYLAKVGSLGPERTEISMSYAWQASTEPAYRENCRQDVQMMFKHLYPPQPPLGGRTFSGPSRCSGPTGAPHGSRRPLSP